MPPPDPAWPPAACSMRRETALRLFHTLLFYDCRFSCVSNAACQAKMLMVTPAGLSASTRFRSYLLDPRQCKFIKPLVHRSACGLTLLFTSKGTTPEPSNIDWSQMSITDWRIQPKPRSEYTDMSFEYAKHRSSEA
jgi:hypothetical protein